MPSGGKSVVEMKAESRLGTLRERIAEVSRYIHVLCSTYGYVMMLPIHVIQGDSALKTCTLINQGCYLYLAEVFIVDMDN